MEELIRRSLTEDGYLLLTVGRDTSDFFKNSKNEKIAELDYNHRYKLRLITRDNNLERIAYHHYSSKAARLILASLFACGYHDLLNKSVKLKDFKTYTKEAFNDYCSMKGIDEELARKFKRLSMKESEIEHLLDRSWFKELYEIKDNKVKLKCNLKVILPKI